MFQPQIQSQLCLGVDLRGLAGSITMPPGSAQDCLDVLPREDRSVMKTYGWERLNFAGVSGNPVAIKGFSYRGKNNDAAGGNTARGGNYSVADDDAIFTRRKEEFGGAILLTSTTAYRWNPTTKAWVSLTLPAGVTVDIDAKPTILVYQENCYIVGFATKNLRYDPTDEALYEWGWETAQLPAAPGGATAAGGNLLGTATYKYAYTYLDLYTGEETSLGAELEIATTEANKTINLTFAAYSGNRHFNDLAISTDSDVAIVVYRTDADTEEFNFLSLLNPGTLALADNGLATDTSVKAFTQDMADEPRFYALGSFAGRFYGLTRKEGGTNTNFASNRLYYSDFGLAPFVERWTPSGYLDLPVTEGNTLTAIGATDERLLVHGLRGSYAVSVPSTRQAQHIARRLPWDAGAVGPKARYLLDGWEYWLSERGPYRWREGMGAPEFIGEPVSPLFLDPLSGLCKLNEPAKELSEVGFDWYSKTVRFIFPTGTSSTLNKHLAYWTLADAVNGSSDYGWFPQSPKAQCMDLSHSVTAIGTDGKPVTASDRSERLIFADDQGYVNEYDITYKRGGLVRGTAAKLTGSFTSSTVVTIAAGTLPTTGDGLKGLRIEVVGDSLSYVGKILSNTGSTITVEVPAVSGVDYPTDSDARIFIGGIPAYWRSWVDHFGDPHLHKSLLNVYFGYYKTGPEGVSEFFGDWQLDIGIGVGEFPESYTRVRSAVLNAYRKQVLVSATGVFFTYEVSNGRPDEPFCLVSIGRDVKAAARRNI